MDTKLKLKTVSKTVPITLKQPIVFGFIFGFEKFQFRILCVITNKNGIFSDLGFGILTVFWFNFGFSLYSSFFSFSVAVFVMWQTKT